MGSTNPLPYRATLAQYEQQAEVLFNVLKSGDEAVQWRFKWEHPHFHGRTVTDMRETTLDIADAQVVVAHEYGFASWADLAEFTDAVRRDGSVERFETASEVSANGDRSQKIFLRAENNILSQIRRTPE